MTITVTLGSDHAGFQLKTELAGYLKHLGFSIEDVGTFDTSSVDYPDYAGKVAKSVLLNKNRGVLICGSGIGASVAANKFPGIRAGIAHDSYSAHQGVEHDDMNVLVLGSRVIGVELAKELVLAFLEAKFSGETHYVLRLKKIKVIENTVCSDKK